MPCADRIKRSPIWPATILRALQGRGHVWHSLASCCMVLRSLWSVQCWLRAIDASHKSMDTRILGGYCSWAPWIFAVRTRKSSSSCQKQVLKPKPSSLGSRPSHQRQNGLQKQALRSIQPHVVPRSGADAAAIRPIQSSKDASSFNASW